MNTKLLLTASAVVMGTAGIAGSFAPAELLRAFGSEASGSTPLVVQLLAALLFGFAMVNWTARGSMIGGIYNRPVAIGNLAHFLIGALAMARAAISGGQPSLVYGTAAVYAIFAVAFAVLFYRSPVRHTDAVASGS